MPELLVSYLVSMCCQEQIGLIMSHKVPGNLWESMGIHGNSRESREFPRPSPGVGNSPPLVSAPLEISSRERGGERYMKVLHGDGVCALVLRVVCTYNAIH